MLKIFWLEILEIRNLEENIMEYKLHEISVDRPP